MDSSFFKLLPDAYIRRITLKDAGERIEACYRHAKRLKRRFRLYGAKGLIHGNRGRPSPNALDHELAKNIIELLWNKYKNFVTPHVVRWRIFLFYTDLSYLEKIAVPAENFFDAILFQGGHAVANSLLP